ncbi:MAG: AAA family ATPase [Armatimonadetes bacterium]|nr:AAA family ATPase [Armatimonadota bacterium]
MKLAVAGKGGVGKTTICAGLALALAEQGERVMAVDADPNNCLGYALGIPPEKLEGITPISDMKELLEERAGSAGGGMYNLTPEVADLIDRFKVSWGNVDLLVMGTIDRGGGGCACPLNSALKQLLRELVALPGALLVDMEAGLEHLGRGTAAAVNAFVIVVDATPAALRTARRISELAAELGVRNIWAMGNRVSTPEQRQEITNGLGSIPVIGFVRVHPGLSEHGVFSGEAGQRLKEDLCAALDTLRNQA